MKNSIQITIALMALLITVTSICQAQTDSCIVKLKNANTLFEEGEYDGVIMVLTSTLKDCNLNKSDKLQANKLLIMAYVKVDNLEEADKIAESVMKIDPYYQPDKFRDDPKLSALFEKYKPTPIFKLGVFGGINYTSIDDDQSFSIVHDADASGLDDYKNKTGFQLGLKGDYRIYKNIWLGIGLSYRQSKYEHLLYDVDNMTIHYEEKISYFDIPLSFRYSLFEKTFSPYIQAGTDLSFLSTALSTTSRDDETDLVDRSAYRNNFSIGYFGSIGISYKIKGVQLFADVSYHFYPDNVNKEETRYADLINVFKYYYIDDDFRMHNCQFSIGISYSLLYKNLKQK